jgi:hypothetical protein
MISRQFLPRALAAALLPLLSAAVFAQSPPARVVGEIVKLDGPTLAIKSATGQVSAVTLDDKVRVQRRVPITLDQIKPGVFLGTTAAPDDAGRLVASEVHVFPESLRGTGEGHRPFGNDNRSTMTNATVKNVATEGTVSASAGGSGNARMVSLAYAGGEKVIIVPATTPVVLSEPGSRADLTPGQHVIVTATRAADGSFHSDRVSVGVNGSVPPI